MPIVTLTTDWGNDGSYIGAMKGCIIRELPEVQIIDITHDIPDFDIRFAAYVLRNCYAMYPKGTIHVIGVGGNLLNPSTRENMQKVYVFCEHEGYYFIGLDDGIWQQIFEILPKSFYKIICNEKKECSQAFPEKDLFPRTIALLAKGASPAQAGNPYALTRVSVPKLAKLSSELIDGEVIYIDGYGNAITNITQDDFNRICKNRQFEIIITSYRYVISRINNSYSETRSGELLAIFSYTGNLEIAIADGNICSLLGLTIDSKVRIKFIDSEDVRRR